MKWYPEAKACKKKTNVESIRRKVKKAGTTRSGRSEILVSWRLRIVRKWRTKLCWGGLSRVAGSTVTGLKKRGSELGDLDGGRGGAGRRYLLIELQLVDLGGHL